MGQIRAVCGSGTGCTWARYVRGMGWVQVYVGYLHAVYGSGTGVIGLPTAHGMWCVTRRSEFPVPDLHRT